MSNEYYKSDLKLLKERSNSCDKSIINSLLFFLAEANSHMAGIPNEMEKEIIDEALKFKKNCSCY